MDLMRTQCFDEWCRGDPPALITAVVLTGLLPRVSVHVFGCSPSSTTYSHSFVVLRSAVELEMSGSWGIPGLCM